MKTLVIYTTRTGNTTTFVNYLKEVLSDAVFCGDFSSSIKDFDRIVIGSYTWGNGKIPSDMKKYLISQKDYFEDKDVFVFGSGLSIYPNFCGAVDGISKIVSDCGGNIKGKLKFEQRFSIDDLDTDFIKKLTD